MRVEGSAVESIAEEWDALADRVQAGPFARPGWYSAWWNSFGKGSLRVLTVRDAHEHLTAVLPVVGEGSVLRSPTNRETPLYGILAADPASAERLVEVLVSSSARRIELSLLDPNGTGFDALTDRLGEQEFRTMTRPVLLSPFLDTSGDWDAYVQTINTKKRSEMRRRRRRLEGMGTLTFEVIESSDRLETLLEEAFEIEESGWKGVYGTAINSDSRTRTFYQDVGRWAEKQGWLRLAFLRLDGRPIAFDLCLESNGVHYLLKTGYDREFSRYGPGVIMRWMMLQRAFAHHIDRYEFLGTVVGTNNVWKLNWTDRYHERVRLDAFAPSMLGTAEWSAAAYLHPLSERARAATAAALGPTGRDRVKRLNRRFRQLRSQ